MPDLVLDYHRLKTPIDHPDLSVTYSKIYPSTGGLLGEWDYYNTRDTPPCLLVVHPTINLTDFNPAGYADYYSARIVGWVIPRYSETYTFYITSDDGVTLCINGTKLVAALVDQSPTTYSATISLTANKMYPLIIGHYEYSGGERLLLEWASTSQARETVPSTRLAYPILGSVLGSEEPAYGDAKVSERPKYDWLLFDLKDKMIPTVYEKKYGFADVLNIVKTIKPVLEKQNVKVSLWSAWENDFEVKWIRFEVVENNRTHNTFIDIGVRKDCFELSGDIVSKDFLSSKIGNVYLELQTDALYGNELDGYVNEKHYLAKMYYPLSESPTIVDDAVNLLKSIGKIT